MQVGVQTASGIDALEATDYFPPGKPIDWNNSSDRRWLMNHLHHCMMNGKSVLLTPESNRTHL